MSHSTRNIVVVFATFTLVVVVIGADAFTTSPTLSLLWPVELAAAIVSMAAVGTLSGRSANWSPGALRRRG